VQPFVQTRLQLGEWDFERKNPLYRPKWKSRAKVISDEDFANRPTVGLSPDFESLQDAMVTLCWLDSGEQKQIYQLYLELLKHSHEKHKVTSHEYIMRVIAQKYNITAERVAGIVQLQHNEEQYKRDPNRKLLVEAAEYMDRAIQQEILDAYQTFNQKKPDEFVEDPLGVVGRQESKRWEVAEDLYDVGQIMQDTLVREEREARLLIDGHVYIEDVDDDKVEIPLSKDAKRLLQAHEKYRQGIRQAPAAKGGASQETEKSKGGRRPRWQYVAQVVNTRELKKAKSRTRGYTNNSPDNTLVEQDGALRAATLADVKKTAWKPTRNIMEHTYRDAKLGWLARTVRGNESAWGRAPAPAVEAAPPRAEDSGKAKARLDPESTSAESQSPENDAALPDAENSDRNQ
jgi:hypothetical protein